MSPEVTVSWNPSPDAGFDQPFDMLGACHERVQRMLSLLRRLRAHVQARGVDEQARQAARDVMRYFDQAAPAHHEDEERHVFPLLEQAGECLQAIERLRSEHHEMAQLWPGVREVLAGLAEGRSDTLTVDDLERLDHYESLYGWHLAAENEVVFPAARRLMTPQSLQAMGREMGARRGLPP